MVADGTCREPLSPLDTACLRLESRTSLIVNAGAMVFARPPGFDRVRETLERRFLSFRRMLQRVVFPEWPLGPPRFEDDPLFDLRAHLHRLALPAPGDDEALQELISDLVSTPLDRARPLWQIHLIENYGTGAVLLFRLHHCLADGMSLMRIVRAMTDRGPAAPPRGAELAGQPFDRRRSKDGANPLVATAQKVFGGMEALLLGGIETLFHPGRGLAMAGAATVAATVLGKLLVLEPDSPTVFKGTLGVAKRVAWSPPLPLAEVRALGALFDASVNEVLLCLVTGALRRYLQHRGSPVPDADLRVTIPVSRRHGESAEGLGNRFSLNLLPLPIHLGDPVERLALIRRRLGDLEGSAQAEVISGLMTLYGLAPAESGKLLVPLLSKNVTAVLSSIPGPPRTIEFAGKPIDRMMAWVPQSGELGLSLSFVIYAGAVTFGVAADAGLVPDPASLVLGFREELADFLEALPVATRAEAAG